ncbi:MAG: type II CAAX endopeptidase family protein [Bradymonadales bacterium]|jgi:membrane protease YdiL (CAAX protease family)
MIPHSDEKRSHELSSVNNDVNNDLAGQEKRTIFRRLLNYFNLHVDKDTFIVVVASMFFLVLYLHHGKASHFYSYFPNFANSLSWEKGNLASYVYSHLTALLILGILPFLVAKFWLKMSFEDLGLRFKRCKTELLIVFACLLVMLPVIYIFSHTPSFSEQYPKLKLIGKSWRYFAFYQAAYLIKWLSWEFFFRGFMLFGLAKRFGSSAILMTTMPFVIAHLGKPELEVFGAIIAGIILGKLSYNGKSIYPTVLLHFGVAFMMDFFTVI